MKKTQTLALLAATGLLSTNAFASDPVVGFGGLIEAEIGMANTSSSTGDSSESGVALATVELGVDAQINKMTSGSVVILHEDDSPDTWEVDAGFITLGNLDVTPVFFTVGRQYVPFGYFETQMVSDPLTLELGETREAAALLGFESRGWYGSLYMNNGDVDKTGSDDVVEHYGVNIGFGQELRSMTYDLGVSYISSIADTDSMQDHISGTSATVADYVGGYGGYALFSVSNFTFIGEYVSAADTFLASEVALNAKGAQPSASNVEVGMSFKAGYREANVAVGYQTTAEAVALGLPKSRVLLTYATELYDGTGLGVEWAMDTDYDTASGGSGDETNTLTVQLAVEF